MHHWPLILAYFGPEVQYPLLSLMGAISGLLMMVGGAVPPDQTLAQRTEEQASEGHLTKQRGCGL